MPIKYHPQWQGPLSGRSFEKQTEDFLNGIEGRVDEIDTRQTPSDAIPMPPSIGSAGSALEYSRGDHSHPLQTNISGSAGRLETPRIISIAGEGAGSAVFDGTSDISIPLAVSCKATGATERRAIGDRFADVVNALDFGAKGDGSTNDSAAFAALETAVSDRFVNLCGGTYVVDAIPTGNMYFNGTFSVQGTQSKALDCRVLIEEGTMTGGSVIGYNAVITGHVPEGFRRHKHRVIAIGTDALKSLASNKATGNVVAIGNGVMSQGHPGDMNIGIGTFALHNNDATPGINGDRNVAVGSLGLFGLTTGRCNVAFGRDTGQAISTGDYNTCLGYMALSGYAPIGLDGNIYCVNNLTGHNNTCVGRNTAPKLSGSSSGNTALGFNALENAKNSSNNVAIGAGTLGYSGTNTSYNGKNLIISTIQGTYSQTGNTITITASGHSAVQDCYVEVTFTSGDLESIGSDKQYLYVSSVDSASVFSVTSPVSTTASGDCELSAFEQSATSTETLAGAICIGENAGRYLSSCEESIIIGREAGKFSDSASSNASTYCVIIGTSACSSAQKVTSGVIIGYECFKDYSSSSNVGYCTAIGSRAVMRATGATRSVFIGSQSGNRAAIMTNCVALGHQALFSDSATSAITNSIAIGYLADVTGDNQAQIGNSNVTTYVYGSVQDRSDARDKADIRDTALGLDFLLSLRPVDFKWDYREDYIETIENEETGEIETVVHEKDGSKKRTRYHHGLIAQDVKAVLDEKGIDFGGYQDHKINGGKDVLTIGYEEFIAPMIKAFQEIDARLKALEA